MGRDLRPDSGGTRSVGCHRAIGGILGQGPGIIDAPWGDSPGRRGKGGVRRGGSRARSTGVSGRSTFRRSWRRGACARVLPRGGWSARLGRGL